MWMIEFLLIYILVPVRSDAGKFYYTPYDSYIIMFYKIFEDCGYCGLCCGLFNFAMFGIGKLSVDNGLYD